MIYSISRGGWYNCRSSKKRLTPINNSSRLSNNHFKCNNSRYQSSKNRERMNQHYWTCLIIIHSSSNKIVSSRIYRGEKLCIELILKLICSRLFLKLLIIRVTIIITNSVEKNKFYLSFICTFIFKLIFLKY